MIKHLKELIDKYINETEIKKFFIKQEKQLK